LIYDIDDEMVNLMHRRGADFLDMRSVDGLTSDMYMDFIHLKKEGRIRFTEALGRRIATLIGRDQGPAKQ
jgi:hypothetical protein